MIRQPRILYVVPIALATLAPFLLGAGTVGGATALPPGSCKPIVPFNASNFEHSTRIDNKFLPLTPGTRLTLQGRSTSDGSTLPHKVVFTTTDLAKKIDGVLSLVVVDIDISDGQKQEAELSFWAQDKTGNVWNTGEYPEEFEDGVFRGAPDAWFSGLRGAQGGIHMLADPELGTPRYLQGFSPSIDFLDCARVFAKHQTVCVPVHCSNNVLVTDETSPLSDTPQAHQRKFHAPGVGIVKITSVNDPEAENLDLVGLEHLDARGLARVRETALSLEHHAYRTNGLYQHTPPMVRCAVLNGQDQTEQQDALASTCE